MATDGQDAGPDAHRLNDPHLGHGGAAGRVEPVASRAELREFIELPGRLDGWARNRVPVMADEITKWYQNKGALPGVRLWLARDRGGRAVGRMVTHRSALFDGRLARGPAALGERVRAQLFGAFVAADPGTARQLLRTVSRMARGIAATHVFGPCSLLPNWGGAGVLRSGFDRPGFTAGVWNPHWLPEVLENEGFRPWQTADEWCIEVAGVPAARARRPSEAEWRAKGLTMRRARRFRVRRAAEDLLWVLNDAYGGLPYFTKISRELLREKLAGLETVLDPELIVLADDAVDGRTVSFSLAVPDVAPALRAADGRVDHRSAPRLLRQAVRRRGGDAVLIAQGTHPDAQLQGALGLVTRELYASLRERGYRRLYVNRISRDNPGAAAVLGKAGGRPVREVAFYVRRLPTDHWREVDDGGVDDAVLG